MQGLMGIAGVRNPHVLYNMALITYARHLSSCDAVSNRKPLQGIPGFI
jgi:hypothetical protein